VSCHAETVSATSAIGSLDTLDPVLVSVDLPETETAPAEFTASWLFFDDHAGSVAATLYGPGEASQDLGTGAFEGNMLLQIEEAGDYAFTLVATDAFGNTTESSSNLLIEAVVEAGEMAEAFQLHAAYPNPFNPVTTLSYTLPETADVRLSIVDLKGRHVATLVDGLQEAGSHALQVNAAGWSSGLYFALLEADGARATSKLVLSK